MFNIIRAGLSLEYTSLFLPSPLPLPLPISSGLVSPRPRPPRLLFLFLQLDNRIPTRWLPLLARSSLPGTVLLLLPFVLSPRVDTCTQRSRTNWPSLHSVIKCPPDWKPISLLSLSLSPLLHGLKNRISRLNGISLSLCSGRDTRLALVNRDASPLASGYGAARDPISRDGRRKSI